MKTEDFAKFSFVSILDSLPEDIIYTKESGFWSIREEDGKTVIFQQNSTQSLDKFIREYLVFHCKRNPLFIAHVMIDLKDHDSNKIQIARKT